MTARVPAQWPSITPTKIAFIGDFPTVEDVVAKRPLSGANGSIFNAMLRSANLDRDEFYISSLYDELPPEGDKEWFKDEHRLRASRGRLAVELEEVKPNVIVPLGTMAMQAFTGGGLIAKSRGAVTAAQHIRPGAKVIPTLDPGTVRAAWHWLTIVTSDFIKAAAEAELGPEITYPKVQLLIEPTLDDIRKFVPMCQASPKLSVDIETGWGQITAIAFAPTTKMAMSIPFVDLRKPNKSYWQTAAQELEAWKLVREIMEAPNPKIGQNYMYDIFWLWESRKVRTINYRSDTRLRHKVLFPELPADLANMSATYTRVGSYKGWSGRYNKATEKADG